MSIGWTSAVIGAERRSLSMSVVKSGDLSWAARVDADRPLALASVLAGTAGWRWAKSGAASPHLEITLTFGRPHEGSARRNFSFGSHSDLLQGQGDLAMLENCVQWDEPAQLETGRLCRLVRIEADPLIEAGVLVLLKEDVRFGRNHLWRPASRLAGEVAAELGRGRVGVFTP